MNLTAHGNIWTHEKSPDYMQNVTPLSQEILLISQLDNWLSEVLHHSRHNKVGLTMLHTATVVLITNFMHY